MGTDLFRITLSRDVDRSRYLWAMLSTRRPALRSDLPRCLRPDYPLNPALKQTSPCVPTDEAKS